MNGCSEPAANGSAVTVSDASAQRKEQQRVQLPARRPYKASRAAQRTRNPIRDVVERLALRPNPQKTVIPLSIGDPTVFGNLATSQVATQAVVDAALSLHANGYPPSVGLESARACVADVNSLPSCSGASAAPLRYDKRDVVLTCGASHALQMCLEAVADAGDNVLVPRPGFPLYDTICGHIDAEARKYPLVAERDWQADLDAAEALVDQRTVALVVNNPSNPCGAVYAREHLAQLVAFAERHRLIIVADEIYRGLTFDDAATAGAYSPPIASLAPRVPVLTVDGLAKRYLVPGWRVGWVLVYEPAPERGELDAVRRALEHLSTLILGPNSLVQAALPTILRSVPRGWLEGVREALARGAKFTHERLSRVPALALPCAPRGTMYALVRLRARGAGNGCDDGEEEEEDDLEFVRRLMEEESVLVLPGSCFGAPRGYFRVTFCAPLDKLSEAYQRIAAFCKRHYS